MVIELTEFKPVVLHQMNVMCDGRRVGYVDATTGVVMFLSPRQCGLNTREREAVREYVSQHEQQWREYAERKD